MILLYNFIPSRAFMLIVLSILAVILHLSADISLAKPTIEEILSMTPFGPGDADIVRKGETISTELNIVSNREIGVGVACLIKDTQANPLTQFKMNKPLLPENIITTSGLIPKNADLHSFTKFTLGKNAAAEAKSYFEFEGDFGLNLSVQEIKKFQTVNRNEGTGISEFERVIREQLYDRFISYRKDGFNGIPKYKRDDNEFTDPADELKQSLKISTAMEKIFPKYYYAWWNFPENMPPGANESYRWYVVDLDDRPAAILAHRVEDGYEGSISGQVIGERYFYASRFLNVGYALVALIHVEEGRLFLYAYRLWIDEWSGFATIKHSIGQKMMIKRMKEYLEQLQICN